MDWFMGKGRRKDKDSPTPPISDEQKQYLEESCLKQRVIDADFLQLVQLPPNLDCNEWLATHTMSFFNHVNLMYGVVSEYCTSETCSSMMGPDNVQYHWQDEKGKKLKQSAPQYIDHMMSYVQKAVTDESQFPTKFGRQFPSDFVETVRKIQRYLFQVLAHLYAAHCGHMLQLGLQGHLNTLFTHFMAFSLHFHLLLDKESEVLIHLHKALLQALQDSRPSPDHQPSPPASPPDPAAGDTLPSLAPPQNASEQSVSKSRSGSENGAAATGTGVHGTKTLVDVPST